MCCFSFGMELLTQLISEMQNDNGNHQDQVKELTEKTADSLDNLALKVLYVSVQQNNLELCLRYTVEKYVFQYILWGLS